jgi:hypothetical protein
MVLSEGILTAQNGDSNLKINTREASIETDNITIGTGAIISDYIKF